MTSQTSPSVRMRSVFDTDWKFHRDDIAGGQNPDLDDAGWQGVTLPHDWSIEGPIDENHPSGWGGGFLPGGVGWYRKSFAVPAEQRGKRFVVEFDGVYKNCDVWLNGQHLGFHPYGYTSFQYDLTPQLRFGDESNVLAVRVDDTGQPDARWYTGAGIYRHVWLTVTNDLHVAQWGTTIRTPLVSPEIARIQVLTHVKNDGAERQIAALTTKIIDAAGETVASAMTTPMDPSGTVGRRYAIEPGAENEFVQHIPLRNPRLWSVEDPYLYRVVSEVKVDDTVVDVYETPLGVRDARFDIDRGFLLNGEPVKTNGVCIHHEAGAVGAAVPDRVLERRLEVLKAMGCNAIRHSHYPPAPELLDMCDRMGFLVMDEAFDEWRQARYTYGSHMHFDVTGLDDLRSMLRRDRNHPSVVIWSVGNEIPEQNRAEGVQILRELMAVVREEDPTRAVTSACDLIASLDATLPEFCELLDVVGYNYVDRWGERRERYYDPDRERYPSRKMIGTEHSAIGGPRGDYSAEGSWYGPYHTRMISAEQLWRFTALHDYVAGDFMWTGIDYLGEARWPHKNSSSGVIDTCGFPKDGYYFYQSQWTKEPMLHVFPHWNWAGREGEVIPVVCYTNCETVELFLNGKSFGKKRYAFPRPGMVGLDWYSATRPPRDLTTADLHLTWDVPYEPGTLRLVGRKGDEVVCVQEIVTTGEPAALSLSVDRSEIAADGRDVVHVTVRVLDAQGRFVPTADSPVTYKVEGAGRLIAVDNGNPTDHGSYQANGRRAFNGLGLAVVQSSGSAGQIRVTASSPGLSEASVTVEARPAE